MALSNYEYGALLLNRILTSPKYLTEKEPRVRDEHPHSFTTYQAKKVHRGLPGTLPLHLGRRSG